MDFLLPLLSAPLAPFTAALTAALVVLVVEVVLTSVAGSGFSDTVHALVNSDSLPDVTFINWLFLREMPLMMSLTAFVCGFGLGGLATQGLAHWLHGAYLTVGVAMVVAGVTGVLSIRGLGSALHKLKFTNTAAVHPDQFVGRLATMTAIASPDNPGTAKLTDEHGYTHLLMVEPAEAGTTFEEGDAVVLLQRPSLSVFTARKA